MVQFCGSLSGIDLEAEREARAALRLRRLTGAREVAEIGIADYSSGQGACMVKAKNVYRQFRNWESDRTIGEADKARRQAARERAALRARVIAMTAHLSADEARRVCEKLLGR